MACLLVYPALFKFCAGDVPLPWRLGKKVHGSFTSFRMTVRVGIEV